MTMEDAIVEFGFDCKIRKLSPKTIENYRKQMKYLQRFWQPLQCNQAAKYE